MALLWLPVASAVRKSPTRSWWGYFSKLKSIFKNGRSQAMLAGKEKIAGGKVGGCIGHIDVSSTFTVDVYT